jgi:two-component system, LuxR family, sensor kinase FixL
MAEHDHQHPDSEARRILAAVLDSSEDAIVGHDLTGTTLTWNRGAERLYGYTAAEMVGRSVARLIPPDRPDELAGMLERVKSGERLVPYETVRRTRDGRFLDIVLTVAPITGADGIVVGAVTTARDQTARRRAEADLIASERRWRAIIDSAIDGIVVIDAKSRIEAFNPAAERLFGYTEEEVLGRSVTMLMPSPYRDEHDGYLANYFTTGIAKIIGIGREVTGLRRDGSVFPLHLSVGEMLIGGERRFTGTLHDLTSRVQLEERLRSSEERWRTIVESAVDGIVVIDARGCIEAFNHAAQRLFGYGEDELRGQNVNILMPSPYREEHDGYLARYGATGHAKIIGIGREVTGRRKDGTTFPLHLSVGEMHQGGDRKFTGILHDLSTRVRMEEQLREQTALARLGEMAAVLAHEVKNPLAGVRGAVQVIGSRLPPGSKDARVAQEIVARIDGLNNLMQDLLLFARPPQPNPTSVDLARLVTTTADLLGSDPSMAGVRVDVEGSAPPVTADPELLKIVFLNLLVNGAHAMQGKGSIHVSVRPGKEACYVTVRDSGPGIPADVRERIFTPFFTTKSRGSGLGLATAKRLVEAHAGTISVECPSGGGTSVTIELPA